MEAWTHGHDIDVIVFDSSPDDLYWINEGIQKWNQSSTTCSIHFNAATAAPASYTGQQGGDLTGIPAYTIWLHVLRIIARPIRAIRELARLRRSTV